jgi:hypothetical protein
MRHIMSHRKPGGVHTIMVKAVSCAPMYQMLYRALSGQMRALNSAALAASNVSQAARMRESA